MEAPHVELDSWKSGKSSSGSQVARAASDEAHEREFIKYTGVSPKWCYRLMLATLMLRLMSHCWFAMIVLEYNRFYVTNDLGFANTLRAATVTPQYALQALFFPFWGVVADRISRRKVLLTASLAACCSSWLTTLVPSVEMHIVCAVLDIVANVGNPIRDAMLRDIFTTGQWESTHGGATGLKARMFVMGQVAFMVATAIGMLLLQLGNLGYGLPNEYQLHKSECGQYYCLDESQVSWASRWQLSGCLRLLSAMSSIALTLEFCIVAFAYPETLRPEFRDGVSIRTFIKNSWWELARPWNNLRVLATPQLRSLMCIRFFAYTILAGWSSIYLSFYGRFEFDTSTMTLQTLSIGVVTWLTIMVVPRLVVRFGDLRGVWVPSLCAMSLLCLSLSLLPAGQGTLVFIIGPLFAGPFSGLAAMAQELLPKLVPADLQATYRTADTFVSSVAHAGTTLLWNLLFVQSKNLSYPLDGLPLWVALGLTGLMMCWTLRMLRDDPRHSILEGKALDAFWQSPYVKSKWYKYHSGGNNSKATDFELEPASEAPPGQISDAAPGGSATVHEVGRPEPADNSTKPNDVDTTEMECRV